MHNNDILTKRHKPFKLKILFVILYLGLFFVSLVSIFDPPP